MRFEMAPELPLQFVCQTVANYLSRVPKLPLQDRLLHWLRVRVHSVHQSDFIGVHDGTFLSIVHTFIRAPLRVGS